MDYKCLHSFTPQLKGEGVPKLVRQALPVGTRKIPPERMRQAVQNVRHGILNFHSAAVDGNFRQLIVCSGFWRVGTVWGGRVVSGFSRGLAVPKIGTWSTQAPRPGFWL